MRRRLAAVALAIALAVPLGGCMQMAMLDMLQEATRPPPPDGNQADPDEPPPGR